MNLAPAAAVLVVACMVLAAFGGYEYSQSAYQAGVAQGISAQVSSLSSANSALQGQISSLQTSTSASILNGQPAQAFAGVGSDPGAVTITTQGQTTFVTQTGMGSGNQSQTSQGVVTPLIYSESFVAKPAASATSTTFPFLSQITPRSWGDTGIVIGGTSASPARVSQTTYHDCVFVKVCRVGLRGPVAAGDILLVFVSGYSPNVGWHASSVNDSMGSSFSLYKVSNWLAGPNAYTDSLYYTTVASGAASDSITVAYNSLAQHSDPIVMDVTGSGLSVLGGGSQDCTSACTTDITTPPVPLGARYLAAANAYTDLGIAASAQTGWTGVLSGAVFAGDTSFMTAEYASSQNAAQSCTYVPILPSDFAAQASGYLSVTGTISAPSETLVVSEPFVSSASSTYVLTPSSPFITTTTVSTSTTTGASTTTTVSGPTTNSTSNYVSLKIPVQPGNVVVDLENCGSSTISATLSVDIVT